LFVNGYQGTLDGAARQKYERRRKKAEGSKFR
jgi:hypothetical protein